MTAIKTVLVIEDDRFIGEMYVRSLQAAGYQATWVTGGSQGLKAALDHSYDLILLDLMLPEKQGGEVLEELRGNGHDRVPNSRIIILTNFDQDEGSRAAMQAKADGYLIKADITPRRLLEIIEGFEVQSSK